MAYKLDLFLAFEREALIEICSHYCVYGNYYETYKSL